jgi:hypothetical protein
LSSEARCWASSRKSSHHRDFRPGIPSAPGANPVSRMNIHRDSQGGAARPCSEDRVDRQLGAGLAGLVATKRVRPRRRYSAALWVPLFLVACMATIRGVALVNARQFSFSALAGLPARPALAPVDDFLARCPRVAEKAAVDSVVNLLFARIRRWAQWKVAARPPSPARR